MSNAAERKAKSFTEVDAKLAYTVIALLDTCSIAIEDIGEQACGKHALRYAASVAVTLRYASDLLTDIHAKLDNLGRLEVSE